ncbi:Zn(II)2Cys6 transcription factor [Aspergillus lucknowensis]|uniref:Fungal-specific transcription factor domain-containing protein n=1 Tax=Aspergillus lucknowensis TaxID=176173 RepID=A0ABR4LF81_9EURO
MDSEQRHRRSRDGCWTCRRRKKKCDGTDAPCGNCSRLGLPCERDVRLVWEDDSRRDAMKRRGSTVRRSSRQPNEMERRVAEDTVPLEMEASDSLPGGDSSNLIRRSLSEWPFELERDEFLLLDHYIQRFSKTYPTFSGPTNPFLTVILPLSTKSRVVLDSLLALSGVQTWENGAFAMGEAMLRMRRKALRGCRKLLTQLNQAEVELDKLSTWDITGENTIGLFASCMLLLLYEKLVGEEQENWSPHLSFFARLCPRAGVPASSSWNGVFQFLLNLFLYNDLVRSTSLETSTLSDFYLDEMPSMIPEIWQDPNLDRFTFPRLIARISAGDTSVTDADIAAWDGRLDWFPSFALVSSQNLENTVVFDDFFLVLDPCVHCIEHLIPPSELIDEKLVSRLYRIAAMAYRRQRQRECATSAYPEAVSSNSLALWAVQLVKLVPEGSSYENTLLWPIGIIAKELTIRDGMERVYIVSRLGTLERQFHMKHFARVKDFLLRFWMAKDQGMRNNNGCVILLG